MPPLAAIIPAAIAGITAGIGAAVAGFSMLTAALIGFGTFALNLVGGMLTGSGRRSFDLPSFSGLGLDATDRTQMIRQPIVNARAVVGEVFLSGAITYIKQLNDNKDHHYILTMCQGEIDGYTAYFVGETAIYPTDLASDGWVHRGQFKNKVRIRPHNGAADQMADAELLNDVTELDANFRGRGVAYIYFTLKYDRDTFPGGIPNFAALVRGVKVEDPRTGATVWRANAWLATRWYLTGPRVGLEIPAARIDDEAGNASASICDEIVDTKQVPQNVRMVDDEGQTVPGVDVDADAVDLVDDRLLFERGDRVVISTDGTLPGGLAAETAYYVIPLHYQGRDDDDDDELDIFPRMQFAATYEDAYDRRAVELTSRGTGQHTVTKTGEPRYTANGVLDSEKTPADNLRDLYSAAGALVIFAGGKWIFKAAAWEEPTLEFELSDYPSDVAGPMETATEIPANERANAVHGIYVSARADWQPDDYPQFRDDALRLADGGEWSYRTLDLPLTNRTNTAQRLAKIDLQRLRRRITWSAPMRLAALNARAGDAVRLKRAAPWNWDGLAVQLTEFAFEVGEGEGDAPALRCRVTGRETDAAVFEFDAETEENEQPPGKVPTGSDIWTVKPPGAPTVTEVLYRAREGGGVKAGVRLDWAASTDGFTSFYRVEMWPPDDAGYPVTPWEPGTWSHVGNTVGLRMSINDLPPGAYRFRVAAVNSVGVASPPAETAQEIYGLLAPPGPIENLTIAAIGGFAILRWRRHADLDVRQGGQIWFRHAKAFEGVTLGQSTTIGSPVDGNATEAILPLKAGTYLVFAIDSSGVQSESFATVTTKQASVLPFAPLDQINEHPSFPGTHNETIAADGALRLAGAVDIDDWGLVDDVANWDGEGGVVASGVYRFAAGFDFTAVTRVRLTTDLTVTITKIADLFDSRTSPIDTWPNFDGVAGNEADMTVWVSTTDDDPAGASPVWSPFEVLDVAEFETRGARFEARLTTTDGDFNIFVTELTIHADEVVTNGAN